MYVLHGGEGTGKSWAVRHRIAKELGYTAEDVYSLQFEGNVWFDGYTGEKILLIDDYEPKGIKRSFLLRLTDIYPFHGQVKGGHIVAEWDYVIFTSNYHVTELFVRSIPVEYENEDGNKYIVNEDIEDAAMYSRIDLSLDFEGMPDRRHQHGPYQTVKVADVPKSVSSLLPDTLAHGTIADCSKGQSGCRVADPPATTGESTLAQFMDSGTIQDENEVEKI